MGDSKSDLKSHTAKGCWFTSIPGNEQVSTPLLTDDTNQHFLFPSLICITRLQNSCQVNAEEDPFLRAEFRQGRERAESRPAIKSKHN